MSALQPLLRWTANLSSTYLLLGFKDVRGSILKPRTGLQLGERKGPFLGMTPKELVSNVIALLTLVAMVIIAIAQR